MDRADIKSKVEEIVTTHLGIDSAEDDQSLKDLGADSLDTVELTMAFEEEFDLEISDEEAEKHFISIGNVIDFIWSKVNAAS